MLLSFLWKKGNRDRTAELQMACLQRVLLAARHIPHYRTRLESACLNSPFEISRLECARAALSRLPVLPLEDYQTQRHLFRNSRSPRRSKVRLRYPNDKMPNFAVLAPGFENRGRLRCFPDGWRTDVEAFSPRAIAGTADGLRALAARVESGDCDAGSVTHAVVVLTSLRAPLVGADRDRIWRAFGVPVYEQMLGFSGELLAWECDAHSGLHIEPSSLIVEEGDRETGIIATSLVDLVKPLIRLATRLDGKIEGSLCACGHRGDRLILTESDQVAPSMPFLEPETVYA